MQHGHYLLLQLAASPCTCRSKTQLLTSDAFTLAQLYQVDRAGLGGQCIVPATVNLGLTIHTGWLCSIQADQMEYSPLVRTAPSLLSKQLLKFRTRNWQQQLAPDEVRQLLLLLDQPHDSPRNIKRFLDRFKQLAIGRQADASVLHLSSRISRNGWTYGPSFEFLEWLAQTPVSHVGAVPRFAVLRWALQKDSDLWLPLRGRVSRTSPCVWCGRNARNYPAGPTRGALCYTCTGQYPTLPSPLSDELITFLNLHSIASSEGLVSPSSLFSPIATKLRSSIGPLTQAAPVPLCPTSGRRQCYRSLAFVLPGSPWCLATPLEREFTAT